MGVWETGMLLDEIITAEEFGDPIPAPKERRLMFA
jgi:hypothetical protein